MSGIRTVAAGETVDWDEVADFTASGPQSRHYVIDGATGTVQFGPSVRYADGSTRQHGVIPADGAELRQRLQKYEDQLVKQKRCRPGELMTFVTQAGVAAGFAADLTTWEGPAIQLAVEQTRAFKDQVRAHAEERAA